MRVIHELYEKHIHATEKGAVVVDNKVFLCYLTVAVVRDLSLITDRVYVSTRAIKHLYDSKPAEEFVFLKDNIHTIIKYPDRIYENKNEKRGEFCFIKLIKNHEYLCSVECVELITADGVVCEMQIATAFRIRKEGYLKNYKLLWSWKGDIPSS